MHGKAKSKVHQPGYRPRQVEFRERGPSRANRGPSHAHIDAHPYSEFCIARQRGGWQALQLRNHHALMHISKAVFKKGG